MKSGKIGRRPSDAGCIERRVRRGRSPFTFFNYSSAAGGSSGRDKLASVVRVNVPLDLSVVRSTACAVFALATPMRIDQIVALAVREAQGAKAPVDKIKRCIRATLAGFYAGHFFVDVNGRTFRDPRTVVMCERWANVRFFLRARAAQRKRRVVVASHL